MASTKTFAGMKKPVRQPTPEQIAAFEETGRADRKLDPAALATETQKSVSTESREPASTAAREHRDTDSRKGAKPQRQENVDTESRVCANPDLQEHGNPQTQKPADADSQVHVIPETRKAVNTETRISGRVARLTIDLPEADHTRFKTACVKTRRKMVEEVRAYIEQRTAELEAEAGSAP